MQDQKRTKAQLVEELVQLRQQVAALQENMAETRCEADILLETVPLGIHGCDINGCVTFVNSAHAKLTGYTPEELVGSFIWDRMAPGAQRDSLPAYLKQLAEEQPPPTPYLCKNIRKNGEVHDIRVIWGYRRNSRGDVIGFVSTVADITAERQAEEAVKKAQSDLEDKIKARTAELREVNKQLAIFQSFTEAAHLPFGMADLNDCVTYVNPAMCRLIGVEKPEDAIGKPLTAVYPPDYQSLRDTVVTPALRREGHWEGEVSGPVHGKTIIALQHCFLIFDEDGNPFRLATVLTDITQRKEAEEALRNSEERFALVVRGVGAGIFDWDIRTGKVFYSSRWKELLGYEDHEIGDTTDEWRSRLHPDDRDRVLKNRDEFFHGTSSSFTTEYRFQHKDGSYRWVEANGIVVRDDDGKPYRLVGSHTDITDRRRAEDALEHERQTLTHLLQSSDHERQVIAYEIHDELAQQLAGAIMQFDSYCHQKDADPILAATVFDTGMAMLRRGHSEARRLINHVRPPILDEAGVVAALAHLADEMQEKQDLRIQYTADVKFERLTPILENAIYRICQESLNNAHTHSKCNTVRVTLKQSDDTVQMDICDDGVGFCTDDIPESRFGIAGIRERTRLLGGSCQIESMPGRGTRIHASLPLVSKDDVAADRPDHISRNQDAL